MYTFVVETEGYDKNYKRKKMKSLAGYKEIKNVKFKNVNQSISDGSTKVIRALGGPDYEKKDYYIQIW